MFFAITTKQQIRSLSDEDSYFQKELFNDDVPALVLICDSYLSKAINECYKKSAR